MNILIILKESIMCERMGVTYLSAALKQKGFNVKVILSSRYGEKELNDLIENYNPRVIGYSVMTGEHIVMLKLNRRLKKKFNFVAVYGGPHAIFYPDLIKEEGVDAVCVGEGDIAFSEFCQRVNRKDNWWETPNFNTKNNDNILKNPLIDLTDNLDILPFPDRAVMYEADPDLLKENKRAFFSSRGCPNRCSYCFNSKYNEIFREHGRVVRFRSPENVVEEICQVKEKYGLTYVGFSDDEFILKPPGWFQRFAELYKERVKLPITCNVRSQLVTEEIIALFKGMGVESVWTGVECGNEEVSNNILHRGLTNKQILNAVEIIKRHKIKLIVQNLIGLPVPNPYKIDLETLDFNIKLQPDFAWSSILFPYPGTPIAQYAKQGRYISDDIKFIETNKRSSVLNFSSADKRKVENLHKLFGIIVRFPFLRSYCNFLCALPLTKFYTALFYFWYGYQYKFKIYKFNSIKKELAMYIRLWWRLIRKT